KLVRALSLLSMAATLILLLISTTASKPFPQAVIATPTPQPDGRIIYIVKENDTCISIALLMGISEQDLRELNNLAAEDCQFIYAGQELLIGIKAEDTPVPTAEVTAAPTPTPFKGNGSICIYLFNDENGNALSEETEQPLAGGAVSITNRLNTVNLTGNTDDSGEALCFSDIPEGDYNISVAIPEGYNPTTVMNYALTIGAGEVSTVDFGAQPGSGLRPAFAAERPSPLLLILGIFFIGAGIGLWFYVRRMGT
ncbi:MAG: LysM peptidoglycan-binding domain-containing protein, partial [Anaerolineaceae bacterium]|nr:LysM peptidoglycan-binding domain-containing protein [Anaerolineaceae bacterium]